MLSDHEQRVFEDLVSRLRTKHTGGSFKRRVKAGLGLVVLGLVGVVATFTWSTALAMADVAVSYVGMLMLFGAVKESGWLGRWAAGSARAVGPVRASRASKRP